MKIERSGGQLMKMSQGTPFHHIVEGCIEQGSIGMIAGGSKSRKTWLALCLASALISEQPFMGLETRGPKVGKGDQLGKHKVLILDLEMTDHGVGIRLQAMKRAYRMDAYSLSVITSANLEEDEALIMDMTTKKPNKAFFDGLREALKRTEATLLIVDCLYRCVGEENDNALMTACLSQFQRLRNEFGCTIAIVHHTKKDKPDFREPFQCGRGASAIGGFMEWCLVIEPKSFGSVDATIHHGSRNLRSLEPFAAQFDEAYCVWRGAADKNPDAVLQVAMREDDQLPAEEFYARMKDGQEIPRAIADKILSVSEKFERIKAHRGQPACVRIKRTTLQKHLIGK